MDPFSIKRVEKDVFQQLLPTSKVINDVYARCYCIITIENYEYGVSWASDLLEPTVVYNEKYNLIIIGIDRTVVAISKRNKNIVLCMGFIDFFLFFLEMELGFAIVTETTIVAINGNSLSLNKFVSVPQIIKECIVEGNRFHIKCLDGSEYTD